MYIEIWTYLWYLVCKKWNNSLFQSHIKSSLSHHSEPSLDGSSGPCSHCHWAFSFNAVVFGFKSLLPLLEGFLGWPEPALAAANVQINTFWECLLASGGGCWCISTLRDPPLDCVPVAHRGSWSGDEPFIECLPCLILLLHFLPGVSWATSKINSLHTNSYFRLYFWGNQNKGNSFLLFI